MVGPGARTDSFFAAAALTPFDALERVHSRIPRTVQEHHHYRSLGELHAFPLIQGPVPRCRRVNISLHPKVPQFGIYERSTMLNLSLIRVFLFAIYCN
jgi:hypothetical protein